MSLSKKYANEPEIGEELGSLVTLESTPVYRNIEALFKQFAFLIDPRLKSLQTPSASFPEWDEYAREDLVSEILTANEYILNLLQGDGVKQRHLWRRMMRSESAHIISSFAPSPGFTPNYSEMFSLDYRERIFKQMNEILVKVEPLIEKVNKSIELASLQSQVEQYGMVLKRERALKDATNNLIPGDLIAVAADAQNFDIHDLIEAAECFVTDDQTKELSAEQTIAWASISEGVQNRRLEVGKAVVAQELAILTEAKIPFSPEDKAPIIGIVERSAKRLNALQIKVTVPNHVRYEEKIATINPQITVDSTDSKAYVGIEIVEDKIRTNDDRLISQFYIKYRIASRPAQKLEATI
ncbi:MAG: hypothetical protein WAU07_00245 [Microgenomates group bacterium]